MARHRDDSQMSRFEREGVRRVSAHQAVLATTLTAILLILFSGGSVDDAAAELSSGVGHDIVSAVGGPTGWIADRLPLAEAQAEVTAGLSDETELDEGGFETATTTRAGTGRVSAVTAEAFDPITIGSQPPPKLELDKLLVTGDSMSQPMDSVLARRLAPEGVEVVRDPKLGSGISKSDFVDWGQVSTAQVRDEAPDAIVIFIGAGEGYPMKGPDGTEVQCCGPQWAAIYSNRARQMMDSYRQAGDARVYWLSVPRSRNPARDRISTVVNEAVRVAATPWLSEVRIIDLNAIFSPDGTYTDSLPIDGEETIVRQSDGLHLNDAGAELAADAVMEKVDEDFDYGG